MKAELENLKTNQIEFIKTNPNNKVYLKAEVTFEYIYSDINNLNVGGYVIIPDEYL